MDPTRRPRSTSLTADQIADFQNDLAAVQVIMSGKLDAKIGEYRTEREALAGARSVKELQDEQARLTASIAVLKADEDSVRAGKAAARADWLREQEKAKADTQEAHRARDAVLADSLAAGERLVAEAREAAQTILEDARAAENNAKASVAEAEVRLAELKAQAKTAQGELSGFREALATEKARALQALGV